MFPGPNAQIYYNEAGEPEGWDYPSEDDGAPPYCDQCGYNHFAGDCSMDYDEEEENWKEIMESEGMVEDWIDERP